MSITMKRILLALAIALFVVYGAIGAGWIDSTHPGAFLGFGLALFAATFLG